MLERLGHHSFELPVSTIGIDIRAQMSGWHALAQISLFGELGIIGPMRKLARDARVRGDDLTATAFDFICSDELTHLRTARGWLKKLQPRGIDHIERETKQIAAHLLDRAGILNEDYYLALSKSQIAELLGE
jgi:hypothetical protein